MSEQIPGRIEVMNAQDRVIIVLDAHKGQILVKDNTGHDLLRMGENTPFVVGNLPLPAQASAGSYLVLQESDGKIHFSIDTRGQMHVGGNGGDGDVLLFKAGDDPQIASPAIRLDGSRATLQAGGNHVDGDVVLLGVGGEKRIRLDAATADIHLGGRGSNGDLMIYPASGDNQTPEQTTIRLDGNAANLRLGGYRADGDIALQGAGRENRIHLDAGLADMHLGGNGRNGNLMIYPASGDNATLSQTTIHLDGNAGDIILRNADCAEDFEAIDGGAIEPGTVVVINSGGQLQQSDHAYDKRVAGVISGAGNCRPGIVLGRQHTGDTRLPVALVGKVYCKVDAQYSSIDVGDLLTTSPTPGHAMKAGDPLQAFGAVIGKALCGLDHGMGLIPILVALQ
jgi:hypothetical protein